MKRQYAGQIMTQRKKIPADIRKDGRGSGCVMDK